MARTKTYTCRICGEDGFPNPASVRVHRLQQHPNGAPKRVEAVRKKKRGRGMLSRNAVAEMINTLSGTKDVDNGHLTPLDPAATAPARTEVESAPVPVPLNYCPHCGKGLAHLGASLPTK